jgi:iron(III) transport system substrate-binding protein
MRVQRRHAQPTRIGVAMAFLTVAAIGLAACGSSNSGSTASGAAGGSNETITLYNGQHEQATRALVKAFTTATGIKVNVRSDDETVLAQQIEQEGKASRADVFYTENSPALAELSGKGLLAPVDKTTLAAVPAKYSSPTSDWVGVSARVSVLVYNTDEITPAQLPKSIMDLANPKWQGKISFAPGETDFQPIVTSVAKTAGDQGALTWLAGMKANLKGHDYPDNETIVAKVNSGDVEMGLINTYYWYRLRASLNGAPMHSALAEFAPQDPGYLINVSGAGILKSNKHPAAAQKFLAFLTSANGQKVMAASDSFEYPIGSGVVATEGQRPLDTLQPAPMTIADLGNGQHAVQLLQQAQLL